MIKQIVTGLLLYSSLLFPCTSLAKTTPLPAYEATYRVKTLGLSLLRSTHRLSYDEGKQYLFDISTQSTLPFINLRFHHQSQGHYLGKVLRPSRYIYDYETPKRSKQWQLQFDWQKKFVTSRRGQTTVVYPLKERTQDQLSHQLMLRQALVSNPDKLTYTIANRYDLSDYLFVREKEEVLQTVLGKVKTIKLTRGDGNRTVRLWFAPEYQYVMVKGEFIESDGLDGVATLESYKNL